LDTVNGISGDMTIAGLLDLGVISKEDFLRELGKLNISNEYELNVETKIESGIKGLHVDVKLLNKNGSANICKHSHKHNHSHIDEHSYTHEHGHEHGHDHHSHDHHRNIETIFDIIDKSSLNENIKINAKKVFRTIGEAEAKVHATTIDKIHFHEVGAVDSIVDVVSVCILLDMLEIDEVYASKIPVGSGFVECEHGIMPVPAPATIEILKNVPIIIGNIEGECTTPTGAAIIKTFVSKFVDNPEINPLGIGYGIGKKKFSVPNMLRTILGEKIEMQSDESSETVYEISANIDDMNPEIYSYLFKKAFNLGALDVYTQNIFMKKNRPANKLSILCSENDLDKFINFVLNETTSYGVRYQQIKRKILHREFTIVNTIYGEVRVKLGMINEKSKEIIKYKAEYEDCLLLAEKNQVPIRKIYEEVFKNIKK
jgi:uncharacterized protein (TIGR00299 family) protein